MSTHINTVFEPSIVEIVETRYGDYAAGDGADGADGASARYRPVTRCLRAQFLARISLEQPIQQALLTVAAQEHARWLSSWV